VFLPGQALTIAAQEGQLVLTKLEEAPPSAAVTHHALKVARRVMRYARDDPVGYPSPPPRMRDTLCVTPKLIRLRHAPDRRSLHRMITARKASAWRPGCSHPMPLRWQDHIKTLPCGPEFGRLLRIPPSHHIPAAAAMRLIIQPGSRYRNIISGCARLATRFLRKCCDFYTWSLAEQKRTLSRRGISSFDGQVVFLYWRFSVICSLNRLAGIMQ
jgi:hypothetical protein